MSRIRGQVIKQENNLTIYLVQHGKSVSKEEDPDRPLSDIGSEEVEKIAIQLKEYNPRLNSIFHSNKLRAVQTAEILQRYLNASQGTKEITGMNPNDDVQLFAAKIDKVRRLLQIGIFISLVQFIIIVPLAWLFRHHILTLLK